MITIDKKPEDKRQKITILSQKDLDFSYFCGSGKGGSARNKVASGVLITHKESGAQGRASDSRSQEDNKRQAFLRLIASSKMKFWLARRLYELRQQETLEETIEKMAQPENLKLEIKDENGRWVETKSDYFETEAARKEHS